MRIVVLSVIRKAEYRVRLYYVMLNLQGSCPAGVVSESAGPGTSFRACKAERAAQLSARYKLCLVPRPGFLWLQFWQLLIATPRVWDSCQGCQGEARGTKEKQSYAQVMFRIIHIIL